MIMLNLPRKYLSYSAIDTWLKNKNEFRRRYYQGREFISTPEIRFGKHIAEELENNGKNYPHIRQLPKPEQEFSLELNGVPLYGFIDSYHPETGEFLEYKTGRVKWTQKRVDNHLQLPIYSLAIKELFGKTVDVCHLIWMETRKVKEQKRGLIGHENSHEIELTGEVKEFERYIDDKEREHTKELIVAVAEDISKDYTTWLADRAAGSGQLRGLR